VTGASSGIGRATCQALAKQGAKVVGTARNEQSLAALKDAGGIFDFVVADLTKEGECERMVGEAVELLGGLTTVINAAGVLLGGAMGDASVDLANYKANMICNTQAPFEVMVHSIPHLKEPKEDVSRSIVNVSSVNGKQAFAGCVSYCMSKAAVDQLTRCASVDLAKFGIRVNAVNPGVIETNLQKVRRSYRWSVRTDPFLIIMLTCHNNRQED
jgi:NAD(P)-dependent dehydrogenase (short-subunit alcohol dehydrogenase family)